MELDKYLDDAFLAGLQTVRLVTQGTGALRRGVHSYLRTTARAFRSNRGPAEGGEGVTVVML